jgi:Rieske Fe-S protein
MALNRREFLILSAAATCGCAGGPRPPKDQPAALKPAAIDAGPADQFTADGVYDHFINQGFFVVRKGGQLIALSSLCTHRNYTLELSADQSFYCKAHGSCFDNTGKVTEGPATRDLPKLPTKIDDRGHLIILGRI